MDLAASVGLVLDDPAQTGVMLGALGETASGEWAASQVAVVEPRQNGKGALLEARALGGLFLFAEPLILWTAHEFKTAREGFLRFRALVENYDHLRKRVKSIRVAAGEEGVELLNGCRLRFVARSGGSGRGFSGDCLILDEAYALTEDQMAALLPTLSARPNSQLWYTSSHPLPHSSVLRRLCRTGRAGTSERLAYFEWCADTDSAPDDREAWAAANPAYGIRISEQAIADELAALGPEEFSRERLGIVDLNDDANPKINPADWERTKDPESRVARSYGLAIDIPPDRSRTSLMVAGIRADGRIHGELAVSHTGSKWVPERVKRVIDQRGGNIEVALDPSSPAGSLIPLLTELGIEPRLLSAGDMSRAAGFLAEQIKDDRIRTLGQPELDAAVTGARVRDVGDSGAWKWSRRDATVDISPLVGLTEAVWIVAGAPPEREGPNLW